MAGRARVVACRACRVPSCKASLIIMLGLTERVGRWQSASSGKTKPLMGGERGREKRDRVGLGSGGRRRQGGVYPTCREPQQASYRYSTAMDKTRYSLSGCAQVGRGLLRRCVSLSRPWGPVFVIPCVTTKRAECGHITELVNLSLFVDLARELFVGTPRHNAPQGTRSRGRHAGVRVVVHGDVAPGHGPAVPGSVGRRRTPLHEDGGFCRRGGRARQLRDCRGREHHAGPQVRLLHGMSRADQLPGGRHLSCLHHPVDGRSSSSDSPAQKQLQCQLMIRGRFHR